jgi:hypothetical protein
MKEYRDATGATSDITKEDWKAVVTEKRLTVKQPPDYAKGMMIEAGADIGIGFSKKRWIILHAKSANSFIGSDSPVIQQRNSTASAKTGFGPLSQGIINVFPFASDAALMITDEPIRIMDHATALAPAVRQINDQSAQLSTRIVFSHSEKLLKSLAERNKLAKWRPKIQYDDEVIRDHALKVIKDSPRI